MRFNMLVTVLISVFCLTCIHGSSQTNTVFEPRVKRFILDEENANLIQKYAVPSQACAIPETTDTYRLDCEIGPNVVICTQTCVYGFTLKEGITRQMKCEFSENEWSPVKHFESCRAFVDCSVIVGPTGSIKCSTNYVGKGSICEVSCKKFEDFPAIPPRLHQCDIDGVWTPKLPFCAYPGMVSTRHGNYSGTTGAKLVETPKGPKTIYELPPPRPAKHKPRKLRA